MSSFLQFPLFGSTVNPEANLHEKGSNEMISEEIRSGTDAIHAKVERHPFVQRIMDQSLLAHQYGEHLTDLVLVYKTMEFELRESQRKEPRLKAVFYPLLERAEALAKDLQDENFADVRKEPTLAAREYSNRLIFLGECSPLLLIAHAYVRYLGDLSGGMILNKKIVSRWPNASHFYDFRELLEVSGKKSAMGFKALYKESLNNIALTAKEREELIEEAKMAFELSASLFEAILPAS